MPISAETATDIALAYREIERAEGLLQEVNKAIDRRTHEQIDIRDAFGRRVDGLQLGVPSGHSSTSLFNVPWTLAGPIIAAHIAAQKALINLLTAKAEIEINADKNSSSPPVGDYATAC